VTEPIGHSGSVVRACVFWSVATDGSGSKPAVGNHFVIMYQLLSRAEITGIVPVHFNTSAVFILGEASSYACAEKANT